MEELRHEGGGEERYCSTSKPPQTLHQIRREWIHGMSYAQIALKHQIDPRTAKRYALQNLPLSELGRRDRSRLDPHRRQIERWFAEDGMSIAKIQRKLNRCGVKCGYMTVSNYLKKLRK